MQIVPNPAAAAPPFRLQTAPGEAFAHAAWREGRARALAALERGESVAVLGRAGTGKTLLLRSLAEALTAAGKRVGPFGAGESGLDVVLADEAGSLEPAALAELCAVPVPFAAAGLPEVGARVLGCKRTVEVVRLEPLSPEDVARFVVGRLEATGRGRDVFEPDAIVALARRSGGLFRLVVVLAGSAMFLAEQEGAAHVARRHVDEAAAIREVLREGEVAVPAPVQAVAAEEPGEEEEATVVVPRERRVRVAPLIGALAGIAGLALAGLAGAWMLSYGHRPPPARMAQSAPEPAPVPPQPPPPAPAPAPASAPSVQAAAPPARPPPIPEPAMPTALSFRGPIMNETMGQGGQLQLSIQSQGRPGPVVAHFHAYAGLIGNGELAGTLGPDGRLSLSGQLMMGQNPFECSLSGTVSGGRLTGSATFVRVGSGSAARSSFTLSRL